MEIDLDSLTNYGFTIDEIYKFIPVEKYTGKYFWNSGTKYIRPDSHILLDFEKEKCQLQE